VLKKISIDYAIMEPASRDPHVLVAALPMTLDWLDVGSWPSFGQTCDHDEYGNALGVHKCVVKDSENNLIASSEPNHLITAIGCRDMIIIHTEDATLVCRADKAENIKQLHSMIREKYGDVYL
jgi:mannose-1-phosphate guanylyltransferase